MDQIELAELRAFLAVAEAQSFRRAAERNDIGQPSLSRRVRKLEDRLGVSLFERHSAGVRLTHAGRDYLSTVRQALLLLDEGARRAGAAGIGSSGRLAVGVFASIAGGPAHRSLAEYRRRHPCVLVTVHERAPFYHLIDLREGQIDVAFLTAPAREAPLASQLLWSEGAYVAFSVEHPLAGATSVRWEDIGHERFLLSREEPGPEIHDWLIAHLASFGGRPEVQIHEVARETLMLLVGLGFGVTFTNEHATATRYPEVVFVPLESDERVPFYAVWSEDNDNPSLRRFLSLLRAVTVDQPVPDGPESAQLQSVTPKWTAAPRNHGCRGESRRPSR